jgi:hypothetical protein
MMNTALIGNLVRLRYKLMWAKTRSRNGRIALFFAGYLLAVLLFGLLMSGGFGAGMTAVRMGQTELVAQVVLTALFVQALIGSVVLGYGVNAIFSDVELRRYPIHAGERFLARHIIGIADPFWFFILALGLGLTVGLHVFGETPLGAGLAAVLVLFVVNYTAARLLAACIERLMGRKSGNLILMMFVVAMAILPSLAGPLVKRNPAMVKVLRNLLEFAPSFGAASVMTGAPDAWAGFGLLVAWLCALLFLLVTVERIPERVRAAETAKVSWQSPYERCGALFGAGLGPFVAYWLRFYVRNSRFRMLYLMSLPLAAFLTFNVSRGGGSVFVAALGCFPIATFMATSRMAVNQYGFLGGAYRRLLLLPAPVDASLRTGSYASVLVGASMLPLGALAWVVFAPGPFDARQLFMLLASGVTGMLVFHAAAVWVSLLNPRRGNYASNFGNDLSLFGNILLIGGVLGCIFLPKVVAGFAPALFDPANWWIAFPAVAAAVAGYRFSLDAGGKVFRSRRERLLAMVEGRN